MLQLDDLRRLRSPAALADVYHLLGYPADMEAPAYTPEEIDLSGAAGSDVTGVWLLVNMDSLQHVHFEVQNLQASTLRRITENFLKRPGEYLLSFAVSAGLAASMGAAGYDRLVFVKPRREGSERGSVVRLGRLSMQPARPTPHDLSVLREIALDLRGSPQEGHLRQIRAFNAERVTRRFFDEYKRLFFHVRDTILAENPNAQIGPLARNRVDDSVSLHAFTQRLLGRIIFLYFLQKKGWLDGNPEFLPQLYHAATVQAGSNFYRGALEPLFFEVLNTQRVGDGSAFGHIPYLNGSLFEREYPADTVLNLPNTLFDPSKEGSILNVLGSYNFTVSESGTLEQEISLDPEMLGKVFENMMEEEEAAQNGTFYTPRSIVQFMAEETLTRYLADKTGLPLARLLPLVAEQGSSDSGAEAGEDLSAQQATQIIRALGEVRVLDPAVGTASMLVGFLNAMIRVRRSAEARRGIQVDEGSPALAEWKREYIQHCLYGVDIKQEAVEIARLRLWLSLVVDAQESEPLPNLDYKLMAGDGLLETVDGAPFVRVEQALVGDEAAVAEKALQIEAKHEEFFSEQRPEQRRALRAEIQQLERELFKADVDMRMRGLGSQIRILDREIADPNLAQRTRAAKTKRRTDLAEQVGRLLDQKIKVWDEKEPLPFFLHSVHFAEVMRGGAEDGSGGFDIVLGNPPYVRHERLGASKKAAYEVAFPEVHTGAADLYVYFFAKGLHLLRSGGRLAYITPNKFMRAGYGKLLREHLSSHTRLEMLADFGDLPVFEATTYPLITVLQKAAPDGEPVQMLPERTLKAHIGEGLGLHETREQLASFHVYARDLLAPLDPNALTAAEWTLDDPAVLALLQKLREAGQPLGEVVEGKLYYGIKTGFNKAFVIDEAKRAELIAADPKSEEIIKPFLRGRDVKRWKAEWAGLYLIFTRRGIDIDQYPAIKAHLSQWKKHLTPGIEGGRAKGNYKWYELQVPVAYYEEFEAPKIIYPDLSQLPRFSWDESGSYLANTLYMIPGHQWMTGLLNSRCIELVINHLSPSFMGGARRFFTQYMEQLPIPTPTPEQAQRLAEFSDDSRLDELNALVYQLYGLTAAEIALVERLTAGAYGGAGAEAEAEGEE